MRCSFKTTIRLGLVRIPVKAFAAVAGSQGVHLNQVHDDCHTRIQYRKVCPTCDTEVDAAEIVSAYDAGEGKFIVVDPDELDGLAGERGLLEVDGFVHAAGIDPVHYAGKHYYLAPDGPLTPAAFCVLRDCLARRRYAGLVKGLVHGHDQVLALRPRGHYLLLSALHYDDQVTKPEDCPEQLAGVVTGRRDEQLMRRLIDAKTFIECDLAGYRDLRALALRELIEAKIAGRALKRGADARSPAETAESVLSLTEALERSAKPQVKSLARG